MNIKYNSCLNGHVFDLTVIYSPIEVYSEVMLAGILSDQRVSLDSPPSLSCASMRLWLWPWEKTPDRGKNPRECQCRDWVDVCAKERKRRRVRDWMRVTLGCRPPGWRWSRWLENKVVFWRNWCRFRNVNIDTQQLHSKVGSLRAGEDSPESTHSQR